MNAAMIHVCPLSKVDETLARSGAAHLVTPPARSFDARRRFLRKTISPCG
jgi:predicted protein tyrosine phosphatase